MNEPETGAGVDYERLVRETELVRRIDAVARGVLAHAEQLAEHTAARFDPVGSVYYLDQFLTVAGEDFIARSPWDSYAFAALVVPGWFGRFSVLSKTRIAVIEAPGEHPDEWGGTARAVGLCKFGKMPSLLDPFFEYSAVYPFRAPTEEEWRGGPVGG